MVQSPIILRCSGWSDYALLDSGDRRKLERYGELTLVRPDDQALWSPGLDNQTWEAVDGEFQGGADEDGGGRWKTAPTAPDDWVMSYGEVKFICRFSAFRHVGVFPEQSPHWDWMVARARDASRPLRVLNLFGYTGIASLLLADAGARVTHVDASKKAISWARENQALSGIDDQAVRWICDDAMKFCAREARRGNTYDGILLDPPKFGRGPKNETWQLYDDLPPMMALCRQLLSQEANFLVLTSYAVRSSFLSMHGLVDEHLNGMGGNLESGELALSEDAGRRLLPTSLFVRWSGT